MTTRNPRKRKPKQRVVRCWAIRSRHYDFFLGSVSPENHGAIALFGCRPSAQRVVAGQIRPDQWNVVRVEIRECAPKRRKKP